MLRRAAPTRGAVSLATVCPGVPSDGSVRLPSRDHGLVVAQRGVSSRVAGNNPMIDFSGEVQREPAPSQAPDADRRDTAAYS
jgi:hypothetical protein